MNRSGPIERSSSRPDSRLSTARTPTVRPFVTQRRAEERGHLERRGRTARFGSYGSVSTSRKTIGPSARASWTSVERGLVERAGGPGRRAPRPPRCRRSPARRSGRPRPGRRGGSSARSNGSRWTTASSARSRSSSRSRVEPGPAASSFRATSSASRRWSSARESVALGAPRGRGVRCSSTSSAAPRASRARRAATRAVQHEAGRQEGRADRRERSQPGGRARMTARTRIEPPTPAMSSSGGIRRRDIRVDRRRSAVGRPAVGRTDGQPAAQPAPRRAATARAPGRRSRRSRRPA